MLLPEAGRKEIDLRQHHALRGALGLVDPGMFREVIINLLSNAVKFTHAGGRVELRARGEGRDLVVEVEDSGIGIPPEDRRRIFQEFYQVDGSYTRKYQGTGLGLALVKRMMEMHGGTVRVEAAPVRGSVFTCRFPDCLLEREVEPETAPALEDGAAPSAVRTVLVAENDALSRRLACNALKSRGYRVVEAGDGEEALDRILRDKPDLVLVSEDLPQVDGYEVAHRVRRDPSLRGIPVVGLVRDDARAGSGEFSGTIRKPIRIASFPSQVHACFDSVENVA
jgi:CheY-like chemotaxis protein